MWGEGDGAPWMISELNNKVPLGLMFLALAGILKPLEDAERLGIVLTHISALVST